ncbi:MAG: hypothetical protein ABW215_06500 [Kibdelosporangium sp.]
MSEPLMPYKPMPPAGGRQQSPPKPKPPRDVTVAFWIWLASTVLSAILQIIGADAFVELYLKQTAGQPQAEVPPGTLKMAFIIGVVVVSLVMALFSWKMWSGRNWARMLLTFLGVFGLITQASSVGLSSVLGLVGVLITIAGLVFMFMPPARAYFAEHRRLRLQERGIRR